MLALVIQALTIDKALQLRQKQLSFRKLNLPKSATHGLLHRSKCDSTVVPTYFSLRYAEKLENLIEYLLNFTLEVQMNTQCLTKTLTDSAVSRDARYQWSGILPISTLQMGQQGRGHPFST